MKLLKNRRKLNNKGFTLIELLAVVVILAVVMGIAMTSVLSAMNKSKGGSLSDTAMVIANGFNQKYTEALVDGVPNNIYKEIVGGYDFTNTGNYYISEDLADTFNISKGAYALGSTAVIPEGTTSVDKSFVSFDSNTGKFVVCMFASETGSYYVEAYKKTDSATIGSTKLSNAANTMYACSDGNKSW